MYSAYAYKMDFLLSFLVLIHCYLSALQFQQEEAVRLCLKHLRQNDYQEAFASLQKQAHLDLEHPLLTELHHELVQEGDYTKAELIFTRAVSGKFMYNSCCSICESLLYVCMPDWYVYMYMYMYS